VGRGRKIGVTAGGELVRVERGWVIDERGVVRGEERVEGMVFGEFFEMG